MDTVTLGLISMASGVICAILAITQLVPRGARVIARLINRRTSSGTLGNVPFDAAAIQESVRYFVRQNCQNLDPSHEVEIRKALVATREDLFAVVDRFVLNDSGHKHLFVLADSGTGKTTFMLNYFEYNRKRKSRNKVLIEMNSLATVDIDEWIKSVALQESKVLFLDALDEDVRAIDGCDSRIETLVELTKKFRKVIITCRTQFFLSDQEIPVESGVVKIVPTKAGESKQYEFRKIYISPFDDAEIRQYVFKRYSYLDSKKRRQMYEIALSIPNLSVRPMLLAHLPDLIEANGKDLSVFDMYKLLVKGWYKRESKWINVKDLDIISKKLAVDLFNNRGARLAEMVSREQLAEFLESNKTPIPQWQVTGRSLLNRDAKGYLKFAHRSVMEYLYVEELLVGNSLCYGRVLTDQMKIFLFEAIGIKACISRGFYEYLLRSEISVSRSYEEILTTVQHNIKKVTRKLVCQSYMSTDKKDVRDSICLMRFAPVGKVYDSDILKANRELHNEFIEKHCMSDASDPSERILHAAPFVFWFANNSCNRKDFDPLLLKSSDGQYFKKTLSRLDAGWVDFRIFVRDIVVLASIGLYIKVKRNGIVLYI